MWSTEKFHALFCFIPQNLASNIVQVHRSEQLSLQTRTVHVVSLHPKIDNQYKLMFDVSDMQWLRSFGQRVNGGLPFFWHASMDFQEFCFKGRLSTFSYTLWQLDTESELLSEGLSAASYVTILASEVFRAAGQLM